MSDCEKCGRSDGHWLGCQSGMAEIALAAAEANPSGMTLILMDEKCGKDGCTNPRAVSKGPTPAKYCETHKTGSKK